MINVELHKGKNVVYLQELGQDSRNLNWLEDIINAMTS